MRAHMGACMRAHTHAQVGARMGACMGACMVACLGRHVDAVTGHVFASTFVHGCTHAFVYRIFGLK